MRGKTDGSASHYLRVLHDQTTIERSELARAGVYMIAFAAGSIAAPNILLSNTNSPYRFTVKQLGRYANAA
jgi:hypothetical protein